MLVPCSQCRNPVFVSASALSAGEVSTTCAGCGVPLKVGAGGMVRVVEAPQETAARPAEAAQPMPVAEPPVVLPEFAPAAPAAIPPPAPIFAAASAPPIVLPEHDAPTIAPTELEAAPAAAVPAEEAPVATCGDAELVEELAPPVAALAVEEPPDRRIERPFEPISLDSPLMPREPLPPVERWPQAESSLPAPYVPPAEPLAPAEQAPQVEPLPQMEEVPQMESALAVQHVPPAEPMQLLEDLPEAEPLPSTEHQPQTYAPPPVESAPLVEQHGDSVYVGASSGQVEEPWKVQVQTEQLVLQYLGHEDQSSDGDQVELPAPLESPAPEDWSVSSGVTSMHVTAGGEATATRPPAAGQRRSTLRFDRPPVPPPRRGRNTALAGALTTVIVAGVAWSQRARLHDLFMTEVPAAAAPAPSEAPAEESEPDVQTAAGGEGTQAAEVDAGVEQERETPAAEQPAGLGSKRRAATLERNAQAGGVGEPAGAGRRTELAGVAGNAPEPSQPPPSGGQGAVKDKVKEANEHYHRGNRYLGQKKVALAIRELSRCLEIDPLYGKAYRSLGVAYMLIGRERSAIQAYERFVEYEPGHKDVAKVREIIADYYNRRGNQ